VILSILLIERFTLPIRLKPDDDLAAWRDITALSWRYAVAAGIVIFIVVILPAFSIARSEGDTLISAFQLGSMTASEPIYVLLGGMVALLGSVILSILLIERFTLPIRLLLLPKDFEMQLQGRSGLLLVSKFLGLIFTLVGIAILLIGPIGYQHTSGPFTRKSARPKSFIICSSNRFSSVSSPWQLEQASHTMSPNRFRILSTI